MAPADTAVARFSWTTPGIAPSALSIWPEEVGFGQEIVVILDFGSDSVPLPVDSLRVDASWLEPVSGTVSDEMPLPPPEGLRRLARYRVYRVGPWRAAWTTGDPGRAMTVVGSVTDPEQIATVRDPRVLGGVAGWLLLLVATAVVLSLLALMWVRWRRQRAAGAGPAHRQLDPPAWLDAAIALRTLDTSALLDRERLDGVAGVLRRFVKGRFHLSAEEMTAAEIAAAAADAGWLDSQVGPFAELLGACDDARYAPDMVGSQRSWQVVQQTLDLIDGVRIEPIWTPVPVADLAEARAAWRQLRERYPALIELPGRTTC